MYDEDTGWVYNVHRYYDRVLGGFVSPDPIGVEGGVNPYAGAPNPLTWADPLGLAWCFRAALDTAQNKTTSVFNRNAPTAKTGTVWDDVVGTASAIPGTGGCRSPLS
ncbi:RHS repeat-associated core domain-containing protein [Austwickia chelonae]|uniref:RHS repeat-associated core domain-containing protein n=1 Tax=Austwickia chelonae TaxID=100225 RepID=UPI002481DA1B|nr:RHS repeat-associated core domain-containing protein [Austwickia chelonae]